MKKEHDVDVCVASTPLQLVCCSEARARFASSKVLLVVARPDNEMTRKQMYNIAYSMGWNKEEILLISKKTFYLRIGVVARRLSSLPIRNLFIGNRNSWIHRIFISSLQYERWVLVDDGLPTIQVYDMSTQARNRIDISVIKKFILAIMGLRLKESNQGCLPIYTFFPLPPAQDIDVMQHDFPEFRRHFPRQSCSDDSTRRIVAYIGQPLGKTPLAIWRKRISYFVDQNPESNLVYYMHRKEDRIFLDRELAQFNMEIRQPVWPLEVELSRSRERIERLYSFVSASLITLGVLFPDMERVQLCDAPPSALDKETLVFKMFRAAGVHLTVLSPEIDLPDGDP